MEKQKTAVDFLAERYNYIIWMRDKEEIWSETVDCSGMTNQIEIKNEMCKNYRTINIEVLSILIVHNDWVYKIVLMFYTPCYV